MTVKVKLYDRLDEVAVDAGGALGRAAQPCGYDRIGWYRLTQQHVMPHTPILVARAQDGEAQAWLFLALPAPRRATALASWYTLSVRPIFADAPDDVTRLRLLAAVAVALRIRCDTIDLSPMDDEDGRCTLVERAFRASGWGVDRSPGNVRWVATTAGDFAAYWARRPSRLRSTAKRKAKSAQLEITLLDRFDTAAWADYETVYAQSWKPPEGSPAFMRAWAEQEGVAGTLRLGIARQNDAPVAAQLWTVEHGSATIHKLAYAESARADSPGTVLSEAMFRYVIERDSPRQIDFGTGDDAYKADWMDERRPLFRLAMRNHRSLGGFALTVRDAAAKLVRRAIRR